MSELTASLEDYLEVIYNLEKDNQRVKPIAISKELNISRASVTEALNKLASKGYINYGRYEMLSLTQLGVEIASEIVNKHKTIQKFFMDILGLSKEEASLNACRIEHVITDNAYHKISEYIRK